MELIDSELPSSRRTPLETIVRSTIPYILGSAALLIPCFWVPVTYGGDLSSHLYNAWLAELVGKGQADGLVIKWQFTNVAFDHLLTWLVALAGITQAARIATAISVLIFGWGAFALTCALSNGRPWRVAPALLMLAHGWVLQFGLMNYYLSLGLCLSAMALVWHPSRVKLAFAAGLTVVACMAHVLPVIWSMGLLVYVWVTRSLTPRVRLMAIGSVIAAVVLLRIMVTKHYATSWNSWQILSSLGIEQFWVFGPAFFLLMLVLVAFWLKPLMRLCDTGVIAAVAENSCAQVCILTGAVIAIVPTAIRLPGSTVTLSFIAERMSLAMAVCICGLLSTISWHRLETFGLAAIAVIFFALLYTDQRALGGLEQRMTTALSELPPGSRVVSAITDPRSRVDLDHMIDRACVGRCYSYGNYEPSTSVFRVRAERPNRIVTYQYEDSCQMQLGRYSVRDRDLPLFELAAGPDGQFHVEELGHGQRTRMITMQVFPF